MLIQNLLLLALSFVTFGVLEGDDALATSPEQVELLERASLGDPVALSKLYDQYVQRIYRYVYRRVGQAELAEDITAQVFMRMLESVRTGRGWLTSFSGWLYRIAHNLVIDHYRRQRRATFVDIEDVSPLRSPDGDPLKTVESRLDVERMRGALIQLTEEQAQVITLRFLEDLSIAEVADMMNKTEGAIKALQYRAILALRRVMQT